MTGRPDIGGIIFDFGGVIHSFDNGIFLRNLLGRTDRTFEEVSSLVVRSGLPRLYESGRISSHEFYLGVSGLFGLSIPEEAFVDAFVGIFTPIEPTIRLIRELKRTHRIGLLSNTNEWHFERHIRNIGIFPLFDAVSLSYRVKTMKPEEEIYRDSITKIGLPPRECVFIDDLEENVEGARKLSIHGIRYTGHDALVASLAALGVTAGGERSSGCGTGGRPG